VRDIQLEPHGTQLIANSRALGHAAPCSMPR
jgi:hypothetical protein